MNPKVDEYLSQTAQWKEELTALREIVLECGLVEEWKWRQPCYTFQGTNIIILGNFKSYCVVSFLKGVLLKDELQLLQWPGENSQSAKFLKFKNISEIIDKRDVLKAYIFEAIEVEKAGLKVKLIDPSERVWAEELQQKLNEDPAFRKAFESLTPGRQRAFNIHFSAAKQTATRLSRIEASTARIMAGKGPNDCICGLSKRMPNCDGSHKILSKK